MKILELAATGLEQLRTGQVSYFDWRIRREIYRILNAGYMSTPSPNHQYLAIQSAEFVMPLFTIVSEVDALAFRLLEGAKAFSENRVADIEELDRIQDKGYHASQWFGHNDETEERNFQSAYAGAATYKVLIEVRYDVDPWAGMERLSKSNGVFRLGSTDHTGWISSSDFTDEDWITSPFGDTAALASFAYSTLPTIDEPQPKLLYEFWEWWVKVALPNALKVKSA